jgi:hypothetical protein
MHTASTFDGSDKSKSEASYVFWWSGNGVTISDAKLFMYHFDDRTPDVV